MRGKEEFAKAEGIRIGITPAYAGKSHFALPNKVCIWDHPRLCGEKCGRNAGESQTAWITPAYAGKSSLKIWKHFIQKDHPRLCGEKVG